MRLGLGDKLYGKIDQKSYDQTAFALAAHPDDIEFVMAGTLILLKEAGIRNPLHEPGQWQLRGRPPFRRKRSFSSGGGSQGSRSSIGAIYHESLTDDFGIFYEPGLLARVAAYMREIAPEILLLQSPQDYMEDHQNTVRLGATAAFVRGMPNFSTDPPLPPIDQPMAIYHAQPHGNRDVLRQAIMPDFAIDISSIMEQKTHMLSCHKSQKEWLDISQGHGCLPTYMQD